MLEVGFVARVGEVHIVVECFDHRRLERQWWGFRSACNSEGARNGARGQQQGQERTNMTGRSVMRNVAPNWDDPYHTAISLIINRIRILDTIQA